MRGMDDRWWAEVSRECCVRSCIGSIITGDVSVEANQGFLLKFYLVLLLPIDC